MKIGIVTFQYAYNHGAVLQCLALQRALKMIGFDAEALNYLPLHSAGIPFWRGWRQIKSGQQFVENLIKKLITLRYGTTMRQCFDAFRAEYLSISGPCRSQSEISAAADQYDVMIAGSDQIWHLSMPPVYFLEFSPPYRGKRISYAACCGEGDLPEERLGEMGRWLAHFDYLSVRDEFSREIVRRAVCRDPEIVADPTLLVDLTDVQKKIVHPYPEYIIAYILGEEIEGKHTQAITTIRNKMGDLPVVAIISSATKPQSCPWADYQIWTAGPGEWLYLIANANFVYTDSFHGALFAMKYKKPFLAYYTEKMRSFRLLDMGVQYAVTPCVAGSLSEAIENKFWNYPNYDETHRIMKSHVEKSFLFLTEALGI